MIEPHVPPLRRQVAINHPIEKSLRAVIALQVFAGLGLVGTIVIVRITQPQATTSQCTWRANVGESKLHSEPTNEPTREPTGHNLAPQKPEMVIKPSAASPARCGTAQVVNVGDASSVQLRFDNCPYGLQPEPTLAPTTTSKQRTPAKAHDHRYQQQNDSLVP